MGDVAFENGDERLANLRAVRFPHVTDDRHWRYVVDECRRFGIDPGTIWVKVEPTDDDGDRAEPKIIVTQLVIRTIAGRTGQLAGETAPRWSGPDGVWLEVWPGGEENPPHAAKATVVRKDCPLPFEAGAFFRQCAAWTVTKDGRRVLTKAWRDGAPGMLGKCAIVAGYRAAFHAELGQLASREENDPAALPRYSRKGEPEAMIADEVKAIAAAATAIDPPDDPKYAYRLIDETTPDSRKGLLLSLMNRHDVSPMAKADAVVDRFKQKLPLLYSGHFPAFAAVVLKYVASQPGLYA